MDDKRINGNQYEYSLKNAHHNQLSIKNRRINDLEKEVEDYRKRQIELINELNDADTLIKELISYKDGLDKENRDIKRNQIPEHLREIDAEILTPLK